jgi:hypothetical protein
MPWRGRARRRTRSPPEYAADTIYALAGHDVYPRLTRECGWTGARYAAWLGDTLSAALTRSARRR